jgi:hypothetical protein
MYTHHNSKQHIMVNLGETLVQYPYNTISYIVVNPVKISVLYNHHTAIPYIMVNLGGTLIIYSSHNSK